MSLYALDSDTFSLFQTGHAGVIARCSAVPRTALCLTVITVEEALSGWYTALRKARSRQRLAWAYFRLADTVQFMGAMAILPFTETAIDRYYSLKSARLGVGASDLKIAAIALEHGAILVTRNRRDFQLIPGLTIEDWSLPPTPAGSP
jgi:tRNA(fMet)-specific endonuclease VapC